VTETGTSTSSTAERASGPRSTTPATWKAVDEFVADRLLPADPVLVEVLRCCEAEGLPAIQITPSQGRLLQVLAKAVGARTVLEIGTLGGYSSIWLARALGADGRVVSLELDPRHAEVARANHARAGVASQVQVLVGDARATLPRLAAEPHEPFDLVFIDADRPHYDEYLGWAVRLGRPGTLIVVDNVIKAGDVLDPAPRDPGLVGLRRFIDRLSTEPGLLGIEIQTVGSKGHDGFALALVTSPAR
jgi:predicted O-methyltransferase YrrM